MLASRARGLLPISASPSRSIGGNRTRATASASFRGGEVTTEKNKKERSCISWPMGSGAGTPAAAADMAAVASGSAVPKQAPLEAVLFDIDGTLCDSDPIHFRAFRDLLQQAGFNGGVPITEEFYSANISGGHNDDLARALFPDTDLDKAMKFMDDKEALFRKLAPGELEPVAGLRDLCRWIEGRGLKRAAVTNAPRPNAELMLSLLGLTDFFPVLVIGSECARAKPFPDPYLAALKLVGASPECTVIFEDSASGVRAGVAAGVAVVGLATRNPEKVLSDAGASLVVKDFRDPELVSALDQGLQPDDAVAAEAQRG